MDLCKFFLCITVYVVAVSSIVIDTSPTILLAPYENTYNNIHTTTSNSTQPPHLTDIRIECKATDPPLATPIDPLSCTIAAGTACRHLSHTPFSSLPRDQWTWIERPLFQNCAVAYWIPSDTLLERIPAERECVELIYEPMAERCVAGLEGKNVATLNVNRLPDAWGPGTEWNEGWPSYIVASEPLSR